MADQVQLRLHDDADEGSEDKELRIWQRKPAGVGILAQPILQMLLNGVPGWCGVCEYHEHDEANARKECKGDSRWVRKKSDAIL